MINPWFEYNGNLIPFLKITRITEWNCVVYMGSDIVSFYQFFEESKSIFKNFLNQYKLYLKEKEK